MGGGYDAAAPPLPPPSLLALLAPTCRILPSTTGAISQRPVSGCLRAVRLSPCSSSRCCDLLAYDLLRLSSRCAARCQAGTRPVFSACAPGGTTRRHCECDPGRLGRALAAVRSRSTVRCSRQHAHVLVGSSEQQKVVGHYCGQQRRAVAVVQQGRARQRVIACGGSSRECGAERGAVGEVVGSACSAHTGGCG